MICKHIFAVLFLSYSGCDESVVLPTVCRTTGRLQSPTHDRGAEECSSSLFFVLLPWLSQFRSTFHLPRSLLPVPHWSKLTQHFHPGLYERAQVIIDSDGGRGGHYRIKGDKPQRWKKDEEENKRKRMRQGSRVILRIWDIFPGQ